MDLKGMETYFQQRGHVAVPAKTATSSTLEKESGKQQNVPPVTVATSLPGGRFTFTSDSREEINWLVIIV